ncbi:MAG: Rieske (2Fe-2S) protein [Verrucomicrobiia bacterium]
MNRRQFLLLTAGTAAGCAVLKKEDTASFSGERVVDAGPVSDYAADGIYGRFRDQGFFVIRKGVLLFAVSAICTHRRCKLEAEPNCSFRCPCHGSRFNPDGRVINGPAKRDLPVFPVSTNATGQLLVKIPAS